MRVGADVEALAAFGSRLSAQADVIDRLTRTLDASVHSSTWKGQDADGFLRLWNDDHRTQLAAAAASLRDASRVILGNADEQRRASDAAGGGLATGAATGAGAGAGGAGGSGGESGGEGKDEGDDPNRAKQEAYKYEKDRPQFYDKKWDNYDAKHAAPDTDPRHAADGSDSSTHHRTTDGQDSGSEGGRHAAPEDDTPGRHAADDKKPGVNADVWSTQGDAFAGAKTGVDGSTNWHGTDLKGGAEVSAGASVEGSASAGIKDGAAALAASGAVFAGVKGSANGSVDYGVAHADGSAYAKAGADAEANATLSAGKDGLKAEAGASAFAGASAGVEGHADVAGVGAGAGADVTAGIGAEAKADVDITASKVRVSADLGLTLGVGANVHIDVEVDPQKLWHSLFG